jgi:soluble lytic murein transglycosylase-like protein
MGISGVGEAGAVSGPRRELTDECEIARARRACQDFESIFIHKMLASMRDAFKSEDDEDSDFGGDIFKSMMDEQLSVALARAGGIGLAEMLGKSLGVESGPAEPTSATGRSPLIEAAARAYERSRGKAEAATGLEAYEPAIRAAASDSGISENLIKAVIMQESGGDAGAVSPKGAKGLMQLMDATARELGVRNPFNPLENIRGGARYLARLVDEFKGDIELALASYNAGIGAVRKYGGIPPYEETRDYVRKVMARLDRFDTASGG